jgi:hypothetical protein
MDENEEKEEPECFICFENTFVIKMKNQDTFFKPCNCDGWIHETCLETWYNHHRTCPICCKPIIYFHNVELQHYMYIAQYLFIIKPKLIAFMTTIKYLFFMYIIYFHIMNILSLSLDYIERNSAHDYNYIYDSI